MYTVVLPGGTHVYVYMHSVGSIEIRTGQANRNSSGSYTVVIQTQFKYR